MGENGERGEEKPNHWQGQRMNQQYHQQLQQMIQHQYNQYSPYPPVVPPPIYGRPIDHIPPGAVFAQDVSGYQVQYPSNMEGVPLPPGLPGLGGSLDPLESILGPFPCVRLRSLPFDATLEDILVLFQGLVVLDVLLVGQGEAFVLFSNPMDYQMATQREGQTIGRRYVEIAQGSRAEYYEAITTQQMKERPQQSRQGRGDQPGGVGASDSSGMWGGSLPGQGFFQKDHQGGADPMGGHGIGNVPGMGMLGGVGGPDRGLGQGIPGVGPGGRNIPGQPNVKRTGGGIQVGEHTGFLRMRGLPFSSTKDDIFKFFEGYNPIQESIVLTYRSDGRATGEAYVGFITPDDSKRAMDLHRKSMGTRYIELFISNKDEHGRALQRFGNR